MAVRQILGLDSKLNADEQKGPDRVLCFGEIR
jgi:hypothetical protein